MLFFLFLNRVIFCFITVGVAVLSSSSKGCSETKVVRGENIRPGAAIRGPNRLCPEQLDVLGSQLLEWRPQHHAIEPNALPFATVLQPHEIDVGVCEYMVDVQRS